jgi:hypothetical protein
MSSTDAAGTPRSRAAAANAAIRRLSKDRVHWPPEVLAKLHGLQGEYLDAQREEAALGREDVAEVA